MKKRPASGWGFLVGKRSKKVKGGGSPKVLTEMTEEELYALLVDTHLEIEHVTARLVIACPAPDLVNH